MNSTTDFIGAVTITRVGELSAGNLLTLQPNARQTDTTPPVAMRLYRVIAKHQPITHSKLLRLTHRYVNAARLRPTLQTLIDRNIVGQETSSQSSGRIAPVYTVLAPLHPPENPVPDSSTLDTQALTDEELAQQNEHPIIKGNIWIYKRVAVKENHIGYVSHQEMVLHVKAYVLALNRYLTELSDRVDALEKADHFIQSPKFARPAIPKHVRLCVYERDRGKCVECDRSSDLEFDHIIPVSKGGSNTLSNVQLLCKHCNHKKGNAIA